MIKIIFWLLRPYKFEESAATNSQEDREMMERNADKHVYNSITTVREIYKAADPEMKKRIKADLTKLVGEMPT